MDLHKLASVFYKLATENMYSNTLQLGESTVSKEEAMILAKTILDVINSSNWVIESAKNHGEFLIPVLEKLISGASLSLAEKQNALNEFVQDFKVLFAPDVIRRFIRAMNDL